MALQRSRFLLSSPNGHVTSSIDRVVTIPPPDVDEALEVEDEDEEDDKEDEEVLEEELDEEDDC